MFKIFADGVAVVAYDRARDTATLRFVERRREPGANGFVERTAPIVEVEVPMTQLQQVLRACQLDEAVAS